MLDVGCGGGWDRQIAERFPGTTGVGIDLEPYSVELARRLIAERGLAGRCEARLQSADQLGEDGTYDVATSSWSSTRSRRRSSEGRSPRSRGR